MLIVMGADVPLKIAMPLFNLVQECPQLLLSLVDHAVNILMSKLVRVEFQGGDSTLSGAA